MVDDLHRKMAEALEFYAMRANYDVQSNKSGSGWTGSKVVMDDGNRARDCLYCYRQALAIEYAPVILRWLGYIGMDRDGFHFEWGILPHPLRRLIIWTDKRLDAQYAAWNGDNYESRS